MTRRSKWNIPRMCITCSFKLFQPVPAQNWAEPTPIDTVWNTFYLTFVKNKKPIIITHSTSIYEYKQQRRWSNMWTERKDRAYVAVMNLSVCLASDIPGSSCVRWRRHRRLLRLCKCTVNMFEHIHSGGLQARAHRPRIASVCRQQPTAGCLSFPVDLTEQAAASGSKHSFCTSIWGDGSH